MFSYNHNDPFGYFYGTPMAFARGQQRLRHEMERRQHIREMERQKLAQIEWRRRMEAKMAMEEEERKRRKMREMEFIDRQRRMEEEEEEEEELQRCMFADRRGRCGDESYYSPGTIVRGPDGRLYRVVSAPSSPPAKEVEEESKLNSIFEEYDKGHRCISDSDDTESVSSEVEQSPTLSESENDDESEATESIHDSEKEGVLTNAQQITSSKVPSVQLIPVEDVPDEEDEELRELRSIWRNRMPSEGQWMEPVEVFGK
ncbi:hypothetical protein ACHAXS_001074 [Conticribra weissflogii]